MLWPAGSARLSTNLLLCYSEHRHLPAHPKPLASQISLPMPIRPIPTPGPRSAASASEPTSRPPLPSRLSRSPFHDVSVSSAAAGVTLTLPSMARRVSYEGDSHPDEDRPRALPVASFRRLSDRSPPNGILRPPSSSSDLPPLGEDSPAPGPRLSLPLISGGLGGGGGGGLQLRVDSYMSQGAWGSRGWAPGLAREPSGGLMRAPPDLQVIPPDDLVKVSHFPSLPYGTVCPCLRKLRGPHLTKLPFGL